MQLQKYNDRFEITYNFSDESYKLLTTIDTIEVTKRSLISYDSERNTFFFFFVSSDAVKIRLREKNNYSVNQNALLS